MLEILVGILVWFLNVQEVLQAGMVVLLVVMILTVIVNQNLVEAVVELLTFV